MSAEYKLLEKQKTETITMDDGGTFLFAPGVAHKMVITGLTIVLEIPAVKGDRYIVET
jgi:hypothetical protein